MGNQICALQLLDKDSETIVDIEWENFDLGREWKVSKVPEGHQLIGLRANTLADEQYITRLAFILQKVSE